MSIELIRYLFHKKGEYLPPIGPYLFEYIVGSNGIFLRAERKHLQVCFPFQETDRLIKGLSLNLPGFYLDQLVPTSFLTSIITQAEDRLPLETLFWGNRDGDHWRFVFPPQVATPGSVVPKDRFHSFGTGALIEVHSHGSGDAFFSAADNIDETGFRIYTVIGNLPSNPTIRTRVGVFGHYWEISSEFVYVSLPEGVRDLYDNPDNI